MGTLTVISIHASLAINSTFQGKREVLSHYFITLSCLLDSFLFFNRISLIIALRHYHYLLL